MRGLNRAVSCNFSGATVECGAGIIEIHTGHYALAEDKKIQQQAWQCIVKSVEQGIALGLQVNAGHGLNYQNVQPIAAIKGMRELNIGHSIVSQAVFCGMQEAVRSMKNLIENSLKAHDR